MNNRNNLTLDRRNILLGGATLAAASTLGAGAPSATHAQSLNPPPLPPPPSPNWARDAARAGHQREDPRNATTGCLRRKMATSRFMCVHTGLTRQ